MVSGRLASCIRENLFALALPCAALLGCEADATAMLPRTAGDAGGTPSPASDPSCSDDADALLFDLEGGLEQAVACDKHSDCTWAQSRSACFYLTLEDVTAFNRRWEDRRTTRPCAERCGTLPSPYLIPRCEAGRCEVIDIREHHASECVTTADCALRVPQCCECGGDTAASAVIALPRAKFVDYQALVCDAPSPTCDACLPDYPPTEGLGLIAHVRCRDGHCAAEALHVDPQ